MSRPPLTSFRALTFDCYGTLIDWESGIRTALDPLIGDRSVDRERLLRAFARHESAIQAEHPSRRYPLVLADVHRRLAAEFECETSEDMDAAFGESVGDWPAFADSQAALEALAERFDLVILSNVDRESFAASNARLGVTFDAVYTAEDVGSYKPDPANFDYMLDRLDRELGLQRGDVLHVAQSLFHDHVPATEAGLATCWIDRQGLASGGSWGATAIVEEPPHTTYRFDSMDALARAVTG